MPRPVAEVVRARPISLWPSSPLSGCPPMFERASFLSWVVLSAALSVIAAPAEHLIVLHGAEGTAEVYDPATLAPIATAEVGIGAFRAVGIPATATSPAKFFVVAPASVTVLAEDFSQVGSVTLAPSALAVPAGVALSMDGARLIVASANGVFLIDTADSSIVAFVPTGFAVAGVAVLPDSGVYVFEDGTSRVQSIDLVNNSLGKYPGALPATASAWSVSPDGSQALAIAGDGLFDLRTVGVDSPAPAVKAQGLDTDSASRLALTNSGRYYVERDGTLFAVTGSDLNQEQPVADVTTSSWAVSPSGNSLYVASDGKLIVSGSVETSRALRAEPTAIEFVAPRVQMGGTLELITPPGLRVAGGTYFEIEARARDANGNLQRRVPVFASLVFPDTQSVRCLGGITDADGRVTMECEMGEITAPTTVRVTVSDGEGRSAPPLSIRALPPTTFEGLGAVSALAQSLKTSSEFTLMVQATRNRLPAAGVTVRLDLDPADTTVLFCASSASTAVDGIAMFPCTTGEATVKTTVTVTVTDDLGNSLLFSIDVDPAALDDNGISKISGDLQTVVQGAPLPEPLVVRVFEDGEPLPGQILNVRTFGGTLGSATLNPPITCPILVRTDENGFASIVCRSKNVFADAVAGVSATYLSTAQGVAKAQESPFRVLIVTSAPSNVTTLDVLSDGMIRSPVGIPTPGLIRVKAVQGMDAGARGVQGVEIHFSADGPVTFDPAIVETDPAGEATTTITMGCANPNRATINVGFSPGEVLRTITVRGDPGNLAQLIITQGDNQSGVPGQMLNQTALVARATDFCGEFLPAEGFEWRVRPAFMATLRNVSGSSQSGRVSALATLGQFGGPFQVTVGNGDLEAVFNLAVNLPASELRVRSGDRQMVEAGAMADQPLTVQALGTTGFGVGGVRVNFAVTQGAATVSDSVVTTDNTGIGFTRLMVATAQGVQQGLGPGPIRVEATALGKTAVFLINASEGPQVSQAGIVNGASFQQGLTPGALATVFGTTLSNVNGVAAPSAVPFPLNFQGVEIRVNGTRAPVIAIANINGVEQINFQVPFETAVGAASLAVDNNGNSTTVDNVPVSSVQPGIFGVALEGQLIAAALHQDFSLITPSSPAMPGEVVQMFFTGGGALQPAVGTNQPGPVPAALTTASTVVRVNGAVQQNVGSFYAPGLITANQTNFLLDANTAAGNHNITLQLDGVSSPVATLPVGAP